MDENGRIVIPGKIRKKFRTRKFFLEANEDRIPLIPVESLESPFGAVPERDLPRTDRKHEEEKDGEETPPHFAWTGEIALAAAPPRCLHGYRAVDALSHATARVHGLTMLAGDRHFRDIEGALFI